MIGYGRIAPAILLLASTAGAGIAHAQEIVQPLPPPGADQLANALNRLASDPHNVSALLDAGDAALMVGDVDAAIGFFGRANELSPGNSRVKLGLAKAYVRSRRPIEALRLFAEAEQAGVSNAQMAEDRGLAFDLVGDNASAQKLYRLALSQGADFSLTLRLALSQAIAGDRKAFEATLLPLLKERNLPAFRTRAFGLAILGDTKDAIKIAETMLSPQMARQMRAYLEYMPQLTQAQQAAASMLGIFPSSGSIGTDDASVAGYSGSGVRVASAPSAELPPKTTGELPPKAAAPAPSRSTRRSARPDRAGTESLIGAASRDKASRPVSQPVANASPSPAEEKLPPGFAPTKPAAAAATQEEKLPPGFAPTKPVVVARSEVPATRAAPAPSQPPVTIRQESPPPPPPAPQAEPEPASVADAFGTFSLPAKAQPSAASGAVDITRIRIPREKPAPPPPPPPPPEPARHWVQVATGKDRSALAFDWRRIARKADGKLEGKGPFVTPWGVANRLLAGPYDSADKAREIMNDLKKMGIDSFTFDSAEGEKIDKLK